MPDRILFIGTSDTYYNEGVDKHLQGMAASASPRLRIEADSATMGVRLWHSYGNLQTYKGDPRGQMGCGCGQGEFAMGRRWRRELREHMREFDELIRGVGARPVLYMDYRLNYGPDESGSERIPADRGNRSGGLSRWRRDQREVAPVGLALERALAEEPDLELYDRDMRHPNAHGTYLTTAVFYATIFDRNPEGLPYGLEDVVPEA